MRRLLYISQSHIEKFEQDSTVSQIVAGAQIRNEHLGLTGALLFTHEHFAQILEGSSASVETLMSSLRNDRRHGNIVVVDQSPITERMFSGWKMAYFGPSQFVTRHVTRLLLPSSLSEQQRATNWLIDLAHEFSSG